MNSDHESSHQPQPIQQKPTNFFKSLKTLAFFTTVLLIALVTGIGGYLLYKNTRRPVPPTTMQLFLQPTPEINHWKTYRNHTVGYTIQYPEGVEVRGERDVFVSRAGVPYGGQKGKVPLGGMTLYFRGIRGLEQAYELFGQPSERTTINGYPALRWLHKPTPPYSDDIFITDSNNKRVIRASITTAGDVGFEESTYELFHQILLTLNFTP